MNEQNEKSAVCRHEPAVFPFLTANREQICRKCGKRYIYKNTIPLLILSIVLVAVIAVPTVLLEKLIFKHMTNTVLDIVVWMLFFLLAVFAIKFIGRKLFALLGKTEDIEQTEAKH